jgi:RimJ/RimL family protein N-acetyltransferase
MIVCETPRLRLRYLGPRDAAFILELLNEPEFIRNVGDREVRTLEDARRYIQSGTVTGYEKIGFGLYLAELQEDATPIGVCGLLKRDYLDDVDVGFALQERFRNKGYALEAARAVMDYGLRVLGLGRIVAITAPDNHASIKLLRRLGLQFERNIRVPDVPRDTSLFTPRPRETV